MTTKLYKQMLNERSRLEAKVQKITDKAEPYRAQIQLISKMLEELASKGAEAPKEATPAFLKEAV